MFVKIQRAPTATPAHCTAEADSTKTMIDRVKERSDLFAKRLMGDTVYGTAPMLGWMVEEKGMEPHTPVWDRSERMNDALSNSDFTWNAEANE